MPQKIIPQGLSLKLTDNRATGEPREVHWPRGRAWPRLAALGRAWPRLACRTGPVEAGHEGAVAAIMHWFIPRSSQQFVVLFQIGTVNHYNLLT